ncbi:MAG: DNA polymerase III subunit delta [Bacteroidaceae bacterium]|nr:DNA polymerase III subunit delta [Bacteroidaceae bacterium]
MALELSFIQIMSELKSGTYRPIYYLMGEEPYFIDCISDYIEEHAIPEEERDFNQIEVYSLDTSMQAVLERARSFPMIGERQVIIVKEAQHLAKDVELLSAYLTMPQPRTVLVFCHKNGVLDKRKKVASDIAAKGILFSSKRLNDEQVLHFVSELSLSKGLSIDSKSSSMMVEFIGPDLSRISKEMEKLTVALPCGTNNITPELVERMVGISKDYNIFEFRNAVVQKNIFKVNQIAVYYEKNSKNYSIQMVAAVLFQFFSNLMLAWYAPDKTEKGIAEQLGLKSTWGVKDYITGMKNYNACDVMRIISELRYTDARSKGVNTTGNSVEGLLREMVFSIMHKQPNDI